MVSKHQRCVATLQTHEYDKQPSRASFVFTAAGNCYKSAVIDMIVKDTELACSLSWHSMISLMHKRHKRAPLPDNVGNMPA
jgi:hypothetical protein